MSHEEHKDCNDCAEEIRKAREEATRLYWHLHGIVYDAKEIARLAEDEPRVRDTAERYWRMAYAAWTSDAFPPQGDKVRDLPPSPPPEEAA